MNIGTNKPESEEDNPSHEDQQSTNWQTENDQQQTFDQWQEYSQAQDVPPPNFDTVGQDEDEFEDPKQFLDYEGTVVQHDGYERPNLLDTEPCDIPGKLDFLLDGQLEQSILECIEQIYGLRERIQTTRGSLQEQEDLSPDQTGHESEHKAKRWENPMETDSKLIKHLERLQFLADAFDKENGGDILNDPKFEFEFEPRRVVGLDGVSDDLDYDDDYEQDRIEDSPDDIDEPEENATNLQDADTDPMATSTQGSHAEDNGVLNAVDNISKLAIDDADDAEAYETEAEERNVDTSSSTVTAITPELSDPSIERTTQPEQSVTTESGNDALDGASRESG